MSIAVEAGRGIGIEAGRKTWDLVEKVGSGLQVVASGLARGSERLISYIEPLYNRLNTTETTVVCRVEELHGSKLFLIAELGTRPAQGLGIRPNSYVALITWSGTRPNFSSPWQESVTIKGLHSGAVRERLTDGFLISFRN